MKRLNFKAKPEMKYVNCIVIAGTQAQERLKYFCKMS